MGVNGLLSKNFLVLFSEWVEYIFLNGKTREGGIVYLGKAFFSFPKTQFVFPTPLLANYCPPPSPSLVAFILLGNAKPLRWGVIKKFYGKPSVRTPPYIIFLFSFQEAPRHCTASTWLPSPLSSLQTGAVFWLFCYICTWTLRFSSSCFLFLVLRFYFAYICRCCSVLGRRFANFLNDFWGKIFKLFFHFPNWRVFKLKRLATTFILTVGCFTRQQNDGKIRPLFFLPLSFIRQFIARKVDHLVYEGSKGRKEGSKKEMCSNEEGRDAGRHARIFFAIILFSFSKSYLGKGGHGILNCNRESLLIY